MSVRRFERDITIFAAKTKLQVGVLAKRLAFEAFSKIVQKTPVDTGRARASWNISSGSPDQTVQSRAKFPRGSRASLGGDVAGQKLNAFQGSINPFEKIWVTNNLNYIIYLEEGSSTQAPRGMVKVTIEELRRDFSRLVRI